MINCKAVIFDLDGTLLDTLADLAAAANRTLAHHGYSPHPIEAYKLFVGDGSKTLITRMLPEDQRVASIIEKCHRSFISDYSQNWHTFTKIYPGIMDLVRNLERNDIKLSVVTNKPHRFAGVMMAHYFKEISFFPIIGQQDGIPQKPHPQQAQTAAKKMGVEPSDCIFIGDSAVDIKTGLRAGMQPMGAGWGFRTINELTRAGALKIFDAPKDFMEIIVPDIVR